MRFSIKRLSMYITTVFGIFFIYLFVNFSHFKIRYDEYLVHNSFLDDSFKKSDHIAREDIHYTKYEFSLAKEFFKIHNVEAFKQKPLAEKCGIFFDFFNKKDPDWKLRTFDDAVFDKNIVNKKLYFKDELKKLHENKKSAEQAHPERVTWMENVTINNQFLGRLADTKITENLMADATTLMRIYGQCFINNAEIGRSDNLEGTFNSYSRKLLPFLTNKLPVFERFNDTVVSNGFPVLKNGYHGENYEFDGKNVVDFIKRSSNGKGIVISAASAHTRDLVKLIHLLRAMNTELPIQVVYKGDLNKRSRSNIFHAAKDSFQDIIDPKKKADKNPDSMEAKIIEYSSKYGSNFPELDIWLVNIQETIKRNYKYSFPGYANKILALLFTSFEEVLLMDADTVPLVSLEEFFQSKQYKESSTMFFKDRTIRDLNNFLETNYFTKLCPTNSNSIDSLFGVKPITNHTLTNSYMLGYRHSQEAGIVAINKVSHFVGILMMFPLTIWKEPVKSSIWGDKEMYWLGLSIAGDENYQFNKHAAASIGEIISNDKHMHYPNSETKELCSSHPGHIDENGKLLWINSGFKYCKKNAHFRDRNKFPFETFHLEELANLYESPLKIRHGIVPPDLPALRQPGSPVDLSHENLIKEYWKTKSTDVDDIGEQKAVNQIANANPQKGWNKNSICSNYQYCAFDIIDKHPQNKGPVEKGLVFEFDEQLIMNYDYLGNVWVNGRTKSLA